MLQWGADTTLEVGSESSSVWKCVVSIFLGPDEPLPSPFTLITIYLLGKILSVRSFWSGFKKCVQISSQSLKDLQEIPL